MWTPIRTAPGLLVAEAWQDLMEGSGIPCELRCSDGGSPDDARAEYEILVPNDRVHVAHLVLGLTELRGRGLA